MPNEELLLYLNFFKTNNQILNVLISQLISTSFNQSQILLILQNFFFLLNINQFFIIILLIYYHQYGLMLLMVFFLIMVHFFIQLNIHVILLLHLKQHNGIGFISMVLMPNLMFIQIYTWFYQKLILLCNLRIFKESNIIYQVNFQFYQYEFYMYLKTP